VIACDGIGLRTIGISWDLVRVRKSQNNHILWIQIEIRLQIDSVPSKVIINTGVSGLTEAWIRCRRCGASQYSRYDVENSIFVKGHPLSNEGFLLYCQCKVCEGTTNQWVNKSPHV
jgi:hypothetical protein